MEKKQEYLQAEIGRLAESYTPEWNFNTQDPDIGSVIGMIYAEQLAWNMEKYEKLPGDCFCSFLDLLSIQPACAKPAGTVLVLEADANLAGGLDVKRGSRFLGTTAQREEPLIFQTSHPVHVVQQRLTEILAISAGEKKVICDRPFPVRMFDYEGESSFCERVLFKHPVLTENRLKNLKFHFEGTRQGEDTNRLFADTEKFRMYYEAKEQAFVLERRTPSMESISIAGVTMTAEDEGICPQFVYDGNQELDPECAQIFGEELQLYKECYIGQEEVFAQAGARITMTFSMETAACDLRRPEPEEELRLIKKRQKRQKEEPQANVHVQKVSLSYFNGQGFRKLAYTGDLTHKIEFICPEDWKRMEVGGYDARCIRIQVIKADQCYEPGGLHFCPVIHHLRFAYSYAGRELVPAQILRQSGQEMKELTKELSQKKSVELFQCFPYTGECMLFGFDRRFNAGPVSMYLIFQEHYNIEPPDLQFEYSSINGFQPLEVSDHTGGFTASGILSFYPPEDMKEQTIEGKRCCWIRVRCEGEELRKKNFHPQLEQFYMNGVEAWNVRETEMESYYIDEVKPNMSFTVRGDQIIDAEVWVNERDYLTDTQMKADAEFYVKWEETKDFQDSPRGARHYRLDRRAKSICFGDGSRVRIPECTSGTAFRAKIRHCAGSAGNVEAGVVTGSASNILFLKRIFNPLPAVGGSDMEQEDGVHQRGSNLLGSGGRLVTKDDYIRETMGFSRLIEQAAYVECADGQRQIVLLMKDFEKGARSFWQIRKPLLKHLREMGDMCQKGEIDVIQPVFAAVSVELWVTAEEQETIPDIKEEVAQRISRYLCPLKEGERSGWAIGTLPGKAQIEMMLYSVRTDMRIRNYHVTVCYTDKDGEHRKDLDRMRDNSCFVCVSGKHRIHVAKKRG